VSGQQRYHTTAAAATPTLAETRTREERRSFDVADVIVTLLRALCGGLCIGGLALVAIGVARVWVVIPAWWSGVVCIVAIAALWFGYSSQAFQDDKRVTVRETRERLDTSREGAVAPPASVPAPPERMAIDLKRPGRYGPRERHTEMPLPEAGGNALARFYWYVLREDRTLAIRPGHRYHIKRPEVKAIQTYFTRWQLGEDLGGTQGVRPNADGREMMRAFVRRYYPNAPLPEERAAPLPEEEPVPPLPREDVQAP